MLANDMEDLLHLFDLVATSHIALTQGRSDLRRDTQNMKTFKKLFLSKEAPDQKSEKKGPEE